MKLRSSGQLSDYEVVHDWLPADDGIGPLTDIADVAVDQRGLVYLAVRAPGRILVITPDGEITNIIGQGILSDRPHGIAVSTSGTIYCVDEPRHAIATFIAHDGFSGWIGTPGLPSNSGYNQSLPDAKARLDSIARASAPFNRPTQLAILPDAAAGFFVTDGYGNAAIHKMTAKGELISTWGGPGTGSGQFRLPHYACAIGQKTLAVCDRENGRIQLYDSEGRITAVWPGQRPSAIAYLGRAGLVYVAEMGVDPGTYLGARGEIAHAEPPHIRILTSSGEFIGDIHSMTDDPADDGSFVVPHGIAVDSDRSIYVAETTTTYRLSREKQCSQADSANWIFGLRTNIGSAPTRFHSLQKFRVRS